MSSVHTTSLSHVPLLKRGKVRDVYDLGEQLLIVATDRISAFDVVMNETIPDKGKLLTAISVYWFNVTSDIVSNHFITTSLDSVAQLTPSERELLSDRSMIVQKTTPLPVECVVRGYLAGSGWKEYREHHTVCGIHLRDGYVESSRLDEPIFTPATKAEEGHDENISFDAATELLGDRTAQLVRSYSLDLYQAAAANVEHNDLILADTKFEFGLLPNGELLLIDEALTPDSSRYWLASQYQPGQQQQNFDKQVLRDWLESITWNKQYPPPSLPEEVTGATQAKYIEAFERITQREWKT
ncbi:MAG: phosphoribosylaminoimidazolesuccinocarboxamide synthase [Ignavibacteria bacterium]|nr:phosphoribosylaminoimidazolesuccinocarboxamide synthase [Ignavibacteria bacterium]